MARTQDVLDHPVTRAVTGTALVGGVVIAVAVSLSALIAPLPVADIREPVVVDEAPGLPSDEEPPAGWPTPTITDDAPDDSRATSESSDGAGTSGSTSEQDVDGGTTDDGDLLDETLDDVTDTVDELVDDVTDTVDDVTDTVDDAVDDVTDTVDETTDDLLDEATDPLP